MDDPGIGPSTRWHSAGQAVFFLRTEAFPAILGSAMKRILIVDDLADNRYLLRVMLSGHGYAVDEARHGAEALALARANPPDLTITDLLMPVMDGYTLLRHWKLDPQLKTIPLVVYTATYTDVQDEQLARDLGADDFLLKPTDPQALLKRLRDLFDRIEAGSSPALNADLPDSRALAAYSQALFRKLEDKLLESESLNQQLRFSQTRLAAILDTEPECVLVLDAECRILDINAAGLRLLGAQALQEVLEQNILPMVGPEHRQAFEQFVVRVFRGERGSIEYPCFPPGGGCHWVETHAAPLLDGEGKVAALLGISHDVTLRKKAEEVSARETRLRQLLLEAVGDGVHGLDLDGRVAFENPAASAMFGRASNEMIGQPAHSLIHHHHADGRPYAEEDCPIYRTLRDGQPRRVTGEVFFRKDGTSFPVEYSCNAMLDASGAPCGVVVCFQDVSARKQAEAAAEKSRRHFESLFENAPVAVWLEDFSAVRGLLSAWGLLGKDFATLSAHFAASKSAFTTCLSALRVLEVNRACLTMHGAASKEELQQGLSSLLGKESQQALIQQFAAIAEGRTELRLQSGVRTLSGEERKVQVRWVAMPGCEGRKRPRNC
jgi:PAS domain S-box-containing protein